MFHTFTNSSLAAGLVSVFLEGYTQTNHTCWMLKLNSWLPGSIACCQEYDEDASGVV
jgi:hypothetical protein